MRRRASALIFVAVAVVASSCRDPTKITLDLRTDVPCAQVGGVTIAAGAPGEVEGAPSAARTRDCAPGGAIGTLVVTPKTSSDASVAFLAVLGIGRDPSACSADDRSNCIFQRRVVSYLPHESLEVPIDFPVVCNGVYCDPSSTCAASGLCVDARLDPNACQSEESCVPGVSGGPGYDGGSGSLDGAADADAAEPLDAATDAPGEDGSDGGGGAASVLCPMTMPCEAPEHCCLNTLQTSGVCQTASCTPGMTTVTCDGPEDCATGACCTNGSGSGATVCAAAIGGGCPGASYVCHALADCPGGFAQCVPNAYGMHYGLCQ